MKFDFDPNEKETIVWSDPIWYGCGFVSLAYRIIEKGKR